MVRRQAAGGRTPGALQTASTASMPALLGLALFTCRLDLADLVGGPGLGVARGAAGAVDGGARFFGGRRILASGLALMLGAHPAQPQSCPSGAGRCMPALTRRRRQPGPGQRQGAGQQGGEGEDGTEHGGRPVSRPQGPAGGVAAADTCAGAGGAASILPERAASAALACAARSRSRRTERNCHHPNASVPPKMSTTSIRITGKFALSMLASYAGLRLFVCQRACLCPRRSADLCERHRAAVTGTAAGHLQVTVTAGPAQVVRRLWAGRCRASRRNAA